VDKRTLILLLTLLLPPLINWFSNAMPMDRASIGFLGAALLTALLVFLQRWQEMKVRKWTTKTR
jgi:hypothetical protein